MRKALQHFEFADTETEALELEASFLKSEVMTATDSADRVIKLEQWARYYRISQVLDFRRSEIYKAAISTTTPGIVPQTAGIYLKWLLIGCVLIAVIAISLLRGTVIGLALFLGGSVLAYEAWLVLRYKSKS